MHMTAFLSPTNWWDLDYIAQSTKWPQLPGSLYKWHRYIFHQDWFRAV